MTDKAPTHTTHAAHPPAERAISRRGLLGLSVSGAGGLLTLALAGCGAAGGTAAPPAASTAAGPASLIVASFGNDANHPPEVFDAFSMEFPKIEIKKEFTPNGTEYYTKLGNQLAADQPPDLWWTEDSRTLGYGARGASKDLAPLVKRDLKEGEYFGLFNARDAQGRVWGLPGILQATALFYNTAAFDEAGIKYPTAQWKLEDLLNAAVSLSVPAKQQYGFYLQPSYITTSWYLFPRLFGADVLDPTRTKAQLTSPNVLRAFEWMVDVIKRGATPPPAEEANYTFHPTDKSVGRSAMSFALFFNIRNALRKGQPGAMTTYDVEQVPQGPGGRWTSVIANCWNVAAKSKAPDAAWTFARWHAGEKPQSIRGGLGQGIPTNRAAAGTLVSSSSPPPKNIKVFIDSLAYAGTLGLNASWADWNAAASKELQRAWAGEVSVATAAADANRAVQQVLDQSSK